MASQQGLPSTSGVRLGNNLVLTSILAILSYVPFELVAKGSLIVCGVLFILDPIPPVTRLISLISLFVVSFLSKLYKQQQQQQEESITILQEEEELNKKKNT